MQNDPEAVRHRECCRCAPVGLDRLESDLLPASPAQVDVARADPRFIGVSPEVARVRRSAVPAAGQPGSEAEGTARDHGLSSRKSLRPRRRVGGGVQPHWRREKKNRTGVTSGSGFRLEVVRAHRRAEKAPARSAQPRSLRAQPRRKEMITTLEYIWLDGNSPTQTLRSKTRIVDVANPGELTCGDLPTWSFDGSSTGQADGMDSDLILIPVRMVKDPLRRGDSRLVLCEVVSSDGTPHATNSRARLRMELSRGAASEDPWFGFEQEYTLLQDGRPLGFPANGYPAPQGPFYCGIGSENAFGRDLVEAHAVACLEAGLMLYGTNAEVMPGQWEFQIGYRGVDRESADPLTVADHLWLARFLLIRQAEQSGIVVSFEPKPVKGDWNGAGNHTNFSTSRMRRSGGLAAIQAAIARMSECHDEHIAVYGAGLEDRLTGEHETCSIDQFRNGVADRSASIRIPRPVALEGRGYLEDRRPGANCDPYAVCARILETVCFDHSARSAA